ncbi:YqcI/YcgG family protein [Salmonella enterica subsp. enterica]|nr:YqcI/YcgG family protein [Salmonella enterica subsp. enterica serovar Mikawasima]EDN7229175.1 YqcI/YcgG family protein [Salmonella enterica subsp. enterica serovar Mikawasima]
MNSHNPHLILATPETEMLLTHVELEEKLSSLCYWKQKAWRQFSIKMRDTEFPCFFSKSAWNSKSIKFLFCEKHKESEYKDLLHGLIEYSYFINSTEMKKRLFSPLVVFFSPEFNTDKSQHEVGWEALKWIHDRDIQSWPENVPTNPDSVDWSFCFNGVQFFINMSVKDHRILRNRNLGSHLTFVINARENFDAVANGNTTGGRIIRERIRDRVRIYNGGVLPSELGFYGQDLEWEQYQLAEPGLIKPKQCPFFSSFHSDDEKK